MPKLKLSDNAIKILEKRYLKKNNEKVFHKLSEALIYLKKVLNSGDTLMIKGSNATGLNDFAKKLKRKKSVI